MSSKLEASQVSESPTSMGDDAVAPLGRIVARIWKAPTGRPSAGIDTTPLRSASEYAREMVSCQTTSSLVSRMSRAARSACAYASR